MKNDKIWEIVKQRLSIFVKCINIILVMFKVGWSKYFLVYVFDYLFNKWKE